MERNPKAYYTKELREEAVKMVTEGEFSIPEVGRRLSIAPSVLRYWVEASGEGKLEDVGKRQKPLTEIETELVWVNRELAEVKMERDIVKKQPRTLRRSGCQVRDHETDTTPILYPEDVRYIMRVGYYA